MRLLAILICTLTAARGSAEVCTFRTPVRYAVSADQAVLLADLDGDGAPEIVTSGNHVEQRGAFSILENRGDGTFASERQVASGMGERIEDAADLDGDGVRDLIATNYWNNGIVVYRGTGSGTAYATATHGGPTRALDYDRDGITDVVSFSFGSGNPVRVHLFRGRGDGTFEPKVTFDTQLVLAATPSIRIRDDAPEILVAEHSGRLAIVRIAGGTVSVSTREAGPGFDLSSTFADVNDDGHADIIDTNDGGADASNPFEWIFVTLATPDGGFLERKQLARPRQLSFPVNVHAADFDGDGRVDLIAGDFRATTLHYFRGDGTGNFDTGVAFDAGGPVNDVAVGDVNGDGRPDLVTVNDDGSVSVIVSRGSCRRRAVRH